MTSMEPRASSDHSLYLGGVVMIAIAAIVLSTFGLIVRNIEAASAWEILFWRSLATTITILVILGIRYGARMPTQFRRAGWTGLGCGVFLGGAFATFLLAITHTTVADTLFLMSVGPFVTAALAWFFLRERVRLHTMVAMVMCVAGVTIILLSGVTGEGRLGQVFAIAIAFFGAGYMILLRAGKLVDMLPAVAWGGVFGMIFALVMGTPMQISTYDMTLALAMGVFQNGIGQALIATGSRHVPAAHISLLMMLEVVLGPFWVWLAVGETFSTTTFVGGMIVLMALIANVVLSERPIVAHRRLHGT